MFCRPKITHKFVLLFDFVHLNLIVKINQRISLFFEGISNCYSMKERITTFLFGTQRESRNTALVILLLSQIKFSMSLELKCVY